MDKRKKIDEDLHTATIEAGNRIFGMNMSSTRTFYAVNHEPLPEPDVDTPPDGITADEWQYAKDVLARFTDRKPAWYQLQFLCMAIRHAREYEEKTGRKMHIGMHIERETTDGDQ